MTYKIRKSLGRTFYIESRKRLFFLRSMKRIELHIEKKPILLDFNTHFAHLVKINESLNLGAADNYRKRNMVYVDVPEIVGITGACENVDTLFKIGNRLDL